MKTVFLEPKEKWELKETTETLGPWACVVRMVLRAPKVRVALWVNLDPRASPEKRENWESRVYLVIRDVRARRVAMVFLELSEFLEKKERRVHRVLQGPQVRGALMVLEELEVHEDPPVNQETRGLQDTTGLRGPQETEVRKGLRDVLERWAPKDPMGLQGRTGCRVIQASGGSRVSKARRVLQGQPVSLGRRVIQEKLDRWGKEDTQAPQDLLESKVYLEPQGRRVQRATPEVKALPERTVRQV